MEILNDTLSFATQNPIVLLGIGVAVVLVLLVMLLTTQSDGGARKGMSKRDKKKLDKMREETRR